MSILRIQLEDKLYNFKFLREKISDHIIKTGIIRDISIKKDVN